MRSGQAEGRLRCRHLSTSWSLAVSATCSSTHDEQMELERKYYFSTRSKVKDSDYVHIKERQNTERKHCIQRWENNT